MLAPSEVRQGESKLADELVTPFHTSPLLKSPEQFERNPNTEEPSGRMRLEALGDSKKQKTKTHSHKYAYALLVLAILVVIASAAVLAALYAPDHMPTAVSAIVNNLSPVAHDAIMGVAYGVGGLALLGLAYKGSQKCAKSLDFSRLKDGTMFKLTKPATVIDVERPETEKKSYFISNCFGGGSKR